MSVVGKPSLMKKINMNTILNLVREEGPISRSRLSKIAKISKPTMSNLITSLKKDQLIKEKGFGSGTNKGGKKPLLYEFNKEYGYVIGSQIRINEIKTIITNFGAEVIYKKNLKIGVKRDRETIINKLFSTFKEVIKESSVNKKDIKGIGLGLTGIVDHKNGVLIKSSHFPEMGKNLEISKLIEDKFKIKSFIDNSARMMACAEKIFGEGRNYNNIVTIDTEEGIGSGVIIKGDILRGSEYLAGEFGHTMINPNGPKCYCGKRGCAEIMISTKTVKTKVKANILYNKDSLIYKEFKNNPDKIKLKDIFNAYILEDQFICSIFEEIENWFAIFIGNIILAYNPEIIIISGDYIEGSKKFVERLKEKSVSKILPGMDIKPNIILSGLGKESGPIGSVSLVLNQMINFHNVWNE